MDYLTSREDKLKGVTIYAASMTLTLSKQRGLGWTFYDLKQRRYNG